MSAADKKILNRLVKKGASVLGRPLEPVEVVADDSKAGKPVPPPPWRYNSTGQHQQQPTISPVILYVKEKHSRSFLPAAVTLYNQTSSQ